jgi:hypothetical protein
VTAGRLRGDAARMLTDTPPARFRTANAVLWALVSGGAGMVANVLLVLFFALARPFDTAVDRWMWLGSLNDVAIAIQFAAFIPVALALRPPLPATRAVRVTTVTAVAAMVAVVALNLLLVAGVLSFDVQVLLVIAAFLVVYGWVVTISSAGHRTGALPRAVTRFGMVTGASLPLGVLLAAPGLLLPEGSPVQLVFVGAGAVVASFGWLALPVWPLLLARQFNRERKS